MMLALTALLIAACAPAATTAPTTAPAAQPTAAPAQATATTAAPASTTAPAGTTAPAANAKKITLGFTASQTGAQNVTSKKQTEGLQLWLDDVTKAGGIKLKDGTVLMPSLKFYDDESKTDRVQELYTKLITDDKVDFLISPYSSGLVKAAAVVSEQNGKVMITAGGADDATMEQGFKNIYQVYAPGSKYLTGAIDLMAKLDPSIKKIAIVNEKDAFSTSVVQAVQPYAKDKGYNIVMSEGYDTGTTDFAPFINKITTLAPDAIIGGGHQPDGTTFAKQLAEKKVAVRFVSLLVAPPEPTFADIGDAALGIIGPSQWEQQATYSEEAAKAANVTWYGPAGKDFINRYTAKFNAVPSYHSAGGYAAGLVLQKALEDAGTTDSAALRVALDKFDLMLFYGRIKFSTDAKTHGKQIGHDMVYMQWQKDASGKLVPQIVWPLSAKSADAGLRK
jgi:branched-chain amino acid transport system substrate-binding protein